jgi:hypothetical protein
MAEEKRKHPRFTVSQFISISFDRENFVQVTAEDISQGGMRCRTTEPVDPLTRVFLMVTFPTGSGDHVLRTEGMVVHAQKEGDDYRLGVQFMDSGGG